MDPIELMQRNEKYVIKDALMPKEKQEKARLLCFEYNSSSPIEKEKRRNILNELLGSSSPLTFVEPTFRCDYGFNIHLHGLTVINFNCVFLDSSPINIGENCFIAPNVVLACSSHPLDAEERNEGYLVSSPINIGKNVWIGTNCTILGGVTIGSNVVIGAGSVVNRSIPDNAVAVGNPCKVLREITEKDKIFIKESLKR